MGRERPNDDPVQVEPEEEGPRERRARADREPPEAPGRAGECQRDAPPPDPLRRVPPGATSCSLTSSTTRQCSILWTIPTPVYDNSVRTIKLKTIPDHLSRQKGQRLNLVFDESSVAIVLIISCPAFFFQIFEDSSHQINRVTGQDVSREGDPCDCASCTSAQSLGSQCGD